MANQKERTFSATRPMILNGIKEFVNRSDLADRSLFLTLETILEEHRRPEAEFWKSFEAERPGIFGALLDGMAEGLRNINETKLPKLPRLADFALWASACEIAYWRWGTFISAFNDNREDVIEHVIEADPIADTLRTFIEKQPDKSWEGQASKLLKALTNNGRNKPRNFPGSPHTLSGHLRRIATFLRKLGIEIEFGREKQTGRRIIRIRATDDFLEPEGGIIEVTEATRATKPAITEPFALSTDASDALKSSLVGSGKDLQHVFSCRLEGVVSIQSETLSIGGDIQKAGKQGWLDKMKGLFACLSW